MKNRNIAVHFPAFLLAAAAAGCFVVPGESSADQAGAAALGSAGVPHSPPQVVVPRSQAGSTFYVRRFGVSDLGVRYTASGSLLEFHYRVVDPAKAQALADAKSTPEMIDQKTGGRLRVPEVEQVGALRQEATLQKGRVYWLMFPNPGKSIKPGDRVDIVIGGSFRVSSLIVE